MFNVQAAALEAREVNELLRHYGDVDDAAERAEKLANEAFQARKDKEAAEAERDEFLDKLARKYGAAALDKALRGGE